MAEHMNQFVNVTEKDGNKNLTFNGDVYVTIQNGSGEKPLYKVTKLTFAQIISLVEGSIKPDETNDWITVIFMYA